MINYFSNRYLTDGFRIYNITNYIIISFVIIFFFQNYDDMFLSYQDECINYNSARSFYETNNLKSVLCIKEYRSEIGEFNWYGPSFTLFYGLITKVFGFSSELFLIINLCIFLLNNYLIEFINIDKSKKIIFKFIFLCSYASFSYVFTFYPEILIVSLNLILLVLFSKFNLKSDINKFYFVLLILLFSFFRITFIFWILILLFEFQSKKRFFLNLFIVFSSLIFVFIYTKLFLAPAYVKGLNVIQNSQLTFDSIFRVFKFFFSNLIFNCLKIFREGNSSSYSIVQIILLTISSIIFILKIKRNKIKEIQNLKMISLLVVVFCNYFILLSFYVSESRFLEKQLIFVIPLLIYIILKANFYKSHILFISLFFFLPYSAIKSMDFVKSRKQSKVNFETNKLEIQELSNSFKSLSIDKDEINVITNFLCFQNFGNSMFYSVLPVSKEGKPILFTTNICEKTDPDSIKYKLFGRMNVDFLLSDTIVDHKSFEIIKKNTNNSYYLYKRK